MRLLQKYYLTHIKKVIGKIMYHPEKKVYGVVESIMTNKDGNWYIFTLDGRSDTYRESVQSVIEHKCNFELSSEINYLNIDQQLEKKVCDCGHVKYLIHNKNQHKGVFEPNQTRAHQAWNRRFA